MDATTVNAIITASAGLGGALIGAGTTSLVSWIQHRRDVGTRLKDERRKVEHDAAKKCEELCILIADNMEGVHHPAYMDHSPEEEEKDRVARNAHAELGATSLYLPPDLRNRMEVLGRIAFQSDELSYGGRMHMPAHYDSPYSICWTVRRDVRSLVAAFLRGEPLPVTGRKIHEYEVALEELDNQRQEFYEMIEQDDPQTKNRKERMEDFYKSHPELRPKEIN